MNRRTLLRAIPAVPLLVVALPTKTPAASEMDFKSQGFALDLAARSEIVSMAYRQGLISLADARAAMGLSKLSETELQEAMDRAERYLGMNSSDRREAP